MRTTLGHFLLLALWLPLPALAAETRAVLPEGCAPAVLAWLMPLEMDKPVTHDWLLRDVAIDRSRLNLTLEGPAGRKLQAVIGHAADLATGDRLGDVKLQCPPDAPADVCPALRAALALQPRAPFPWLVSKPAGEGRVEIERAGQQFPEHDTTRPARGTLLAVWGALLLALALALHNRRRQVPWQSLAATLAVTGLGLTMRLWLAPRGLQHEMFHAGESLAFLDGASHFANGEAVPALVTALNAIWPARDATLYTVTLAAAVLGIPALIAFAWQLTGSSRVALVAGVLLALAPGHVHFAASEEFGIVGLTLALLSWAAWLDWLTTRAHLMLLLATASGVLALQSRPELVLLPLMHLTLTLAVLPMRSLPALVRTRSLWLALGFALLASWHVPLDMQARGGFPGVSPLAVQQLVPRLIWLDPQLAVWPMLGWLVLGCAFGLRTAPRRALWLALWSLALAVLLLSLYVGAGAYAWRMQLLPTALACVLIAWSVAALPRLAYAPVIALVLTAGAQLWLARAAVSQPSLTELQYRFERAHVGELPPHAEILAVLSAQVDHPPRLGGLRPGETRVLRDAADVAHWPEPGPQQVFLQSAACWVRWPGEAHVPSAMHPVCRAVHAHFRLEPIAEMDLPATREPPLAWAPQPAGYRIGFYRLLQR